MKRIACPFCDYDVAVIENISISMATERVMIHVCDEHKGKSVWSPKPGLVLDMAISNPPAPKLQSLMMTVSVRPDNRATAFNLLGVTGHDLLLAGYDFSISANEYDPNEPLPPLPEDLRHDEGTMFKVREAIKNSLMDTDLVESPSRSTDAIINSLLNAGIVFRERA